MFKNISLPSKKIINIIIILFFLIFFLPLFKRFNPFFTVEYGTVGVVSRFGKINKQANPGLNFKIPLVDKVTFYNVQKIIYETSENPNQSPFNSQNKVNLSNNSYIQKNISDNADIPVDTTTKDGQQVSIRYTIRYNLDPTKILWLAENIGTQDQIIMRIVQAESRSIARNVARDYPAQELYTGNVFNYQKQVAENLKEVYSKNGVILDEFLVRQLVFSPQYLAAIEQKQIEQEKVKTEEFKAQQEEFIKQQKIVRSEGEAKSQELLRQTIDPLVLQKMAIEKWNGILPTYMGSGGEVPFIGIR